MYKLQLGYSTSVIAGSGCWFCAWPWGEKHYHFFFCHPASIPQALTFPREDANCIYLPHTTTILQLAGSQHFTYHHQESISVHFHPCAPHCLCSPCSIVLRPSLWGPTPLHLLILSWLPDSPDKILLIFWPRFCLAKVRLFHLISLSPADAIQPCLPPLTDVIICPGDVFLLSPYKPFEGSLESYCSNLTAFHTYCAQVWGSVDYVYSCLQQHVFRLLTIHWNQ